jgi:hypothetical protein
VVALAVPAAVDAWREFAAQAEVFDGAAESVAADIDGFRPV